MQKEEPLIHVLYVQLKVLLTILLSNVVKQPVLESKLFDSQQDINFLLEQFYVTAIKHVTQKIPSFETLKYFQCLSPENIRNPESETYISKIEKLLPLYDLDVDILSYEWRLLQFDEAIKFSLDKDERIDSYWNNIFTLQDQENPRQLLSEDKSSMTERTLNAKLAITYTLKKYEQMVYRVPIVPELHNLAQGAYRSYQAYLEEQKRITQEKAAQAAAEIKRKADEKLLLESIYNRNKTVGKLEKDLESAEKSYKDAESDAESMQKVLKDTTKKGVTGPAISEIVKSLEKLREKEKEKERK